MIVKHRVKCENCIGVIIAWHRYADTHVIISNDLDINSININSNFPVNIYVLPSWSNTLRCPPYMSRQTNYVILIETNRIHYVKEGINIII